MKTLRQLAADLEAGRTTSRALVEACLDRIADPAGEGTRTFLKVFTDSARAAADAADHDRAHGLASRLYAGIPVSVKDLFDVAGDVTRAGSTVLADAAPAKTDAPAVARLRAAGLVVVGRTNMTEFAYSGVGLNPHYDTPRNPWDRATGRIPGGSTAGGAVSVTDGMAAAALGTDTGGSCRIPAALCGLTGFKPTAARVPTEGAVPLSTTLDSVGPLAPSVECCAVLDAILAGETEEEIEARPVSGLRLALPTTLVLDDMDVAVAGAFEAALGRLSKAGARIVEVAFPEIVELAGLGAHGIVSGSEAYAWHRETIEARGAAYDPRVRARILKGADIAAHRYVAVLTARRRFMARAAEVLAPFDALILPTVPTVAPPIAALDDDAEFGRINLLMLRNPSIVNFMDGCAISLPCRSEGGAPVGLMLAQTAGRDRALLAVARGIEAAVSPGRMEGRAA